MPTSSPDFFLGVFELKPLCKIINVSEDLFVPFNFPKSTHHIYPDLAPDFVGDVHCQESGVHFLQMDRLGH